MYCIVLNPSVQSARKLPSKLKKMISQLKTKNKTTCDWHVLNSLILCVSVHQNALTKINKQIAV